ncbi:MAG: FAD-binding protein [Clostridia bacterium]|nr:FAD-binding protein [Clostridia bacterium]
MDFLTFDTIVIGSGAAGFNAACEIKKLCDKTVCIVTEGINTGTSRNTGSDKQTYYKLTLGGDTPDSVRKMAEDLFSGGSVDGDNALCEASLSVKCFHNLCSLGVPFPTNRYGEYIGYKTDHDPYMRATSAGPLTSKFMTEALEKQAKLFSVPIFDGLLAVEILKKDNTVTGLLCFDKKSGEYKLFRCNNIILATGGPAGIYENTVYPDGHTGSTGLAIKAGAKLQNMTEWQYGLSSIKPKWNVSGTYMQVLPRFVSIDQNGNEYEFLQEYFSDEYIALSFVFLKGYQWPFDSKKAENGSSKIDLAVYNECINKKRKVYLDFTRNPFGLKNIDFNKLSEESSTYLKEAKALLDTPIKRLQKMNAPAIELYKSKGVDITKEYLEIALCAQHNNGGIAVDMWWQTCVQGLFAAGECAGTHGVTRPGGSALNAGQAGSLRAAQFISQKKEVYIDEAEFSFIANKALLYHEELKNALSSEKNTVATLLLEAKTDMSSFAAAVRDIKNIKELIIKTEKKLKNFSEDVKIESPTQLTEAYKYYDTLLVQSAVLKAIENYWNEAHITRGSAVYKADNEENVTPCNKNGQIQEIILSDNVFSVYWRNVRPIPEEDSFFENVWRSYRENKNIY